MNITFLTGLLGSLVLVTGAAWPESLRPQKPIRSVKDWLFAMGGLIMLAYAILGYLQGGAIFFIFLEVLVAIASVLMMLDTDDRIDAAVISVSSLGLVIWSLFLFEGYSTVVFIVGLCGVGLGYAFTEGTFRRSVALTLGSALIAIFSFTEGSWVFFWLNVFFALFSGYYLAKEILAYGRRHRRKNK